MNSIAAAAARRAVSRRTFATTTRRFASQTDDAALEKGAKRDPELYALLLVTTGMFGVAGWYFGSKPTSTTSETNVRVAQDAMPWNVEGDGSDKEYKYQYHPHGDKSKPLKNAPSALNTVIVPNVTLPKSLHDQFNKYGKDDY